MTDTYSPSYFFTDTAPLPLRALQTRQAIALQLAAAKAKRALPRTLGEGIASVGADIGDVLRQKGYEEKEAAYKEQLNQEADKAAGFAGLPGAPAGFPAATPVTTTGMGTVLNPMGAGMPNLPFSDGDTEASVATVPGGPIPAMRQAAFGPAAMGAPMPSVPVSGASEVSDRSIPPNPAIPTSIQPAPEPVRTPNAVTVPPVQVAQGNFGQVPPPLPIPGDVERVPTGKYEVINDRPPPPPPTPMSRAEQIATLMTMKHSDDPQMQQIWAPVLQREQAKRQYQDAYNLKEYTSKVGEYEKQQEYKRGEPMREAELRAKALDRADKERLLRERLLPPPSAAPTTTSPSSALPQTPEEIAAHNTRLAQEQRSGVPTIPPPPPGVDSAKWRETQSAQAAKDVEAVSTAVPKLEQSIALVENLKRHPGLPSGTGIGGAIGRNLYGTHAFAFGQQVERVKGKAFLDAYDALRGTGAISEAEGKKAEQAQAALHPGQSEADFRAGLDEFANQMRRNLEEIQRKTNQPVTAWRQPGDNTSFAPDKGTIRTDFSDGVPRQYLGGNPYDIAKSWRVLR